MLGKSIRHLKYLTAIAAVSFAAPIALAAEVTLPPAETTDSITVEELQEHLEYLASDELEGRLAGSPGGRLAGEYIAEQFEASGLLPAGDDDTYFQAFSGFGQAGNVSGRNVIGYIEGSDDEIGREVIVMGAHYDHLGHGSVGALDFGNTDIHNGADDNASGTSVLIELAEAFSELETPVRRTVVFIAFDAEEEGLVGSRHYCANPKFPLSDTVFMMNMDMVGRLNNGAVEIHGTPTADGLMDLVTTLTAADELAPDYPQTMIMNSDHFSFFQKQVPVLFFFTGMHPQYHRAADDADLINYDGMELIGKRSFQICYDIAGRDERLVFNPDVQVSQGGLDQLFEMFGGGEPGQNPIQDLLRGLLERLQGGQPQPQRPLRERAADEPTVESAPATPTAPRSTNSAEWTPGERPTLGVQIASSGEIQVLSVQTGSPAEHAGLLAGDVIISFGGVKVPDLAALRTALSRVSWDDTIELTIRRDGKIQDVNVLFARSFDEAPSDDEGEEF
ncbi:MAG: M28 family peptidase [Planctomycetes bacterium]|nr:M28 family peptidase [Planctomycetota bacterium]